MINPWTGGVNDLNALLKEIAPGHARRLRMSHKDASVLTWMCEFNAWVTIRELLRVGERFPSISCS